MKRASIWCSVLLEMRFVKSVSVAKPATVDTQLTPCALPDRREYPLVPELHMKALLNIGLT